MVEEKAKIAIQRWKEAHREYYLAPKRKLAARPEYKAHRREMYRQKVEELTLLGILPRKRGRPRMYEGEEALQMRRKRARGNSARYRARLLSPPTEKDEYESESASSDSTGSSDRSGNSTNGPEKQSRFSSQNVYWALSQSSG